jgi:hypothetical protein
MNAQQWKTLLSNSSGSRSTLIRFVVTIALLAMAPMAFAAIPWDGGGGDGNWFNPANWNRNMNDNNTLPPGGDATGMAAVTDTEISFPGTASLNGGLGVIYDTDLPGDTGPDNPFFPVAASVNDPPSGFGYQQIAQLYISRSQNPSTGLVPDNTLTLRGDLQSGGPVIVGRSSGVAGQTTNGKIIQESGLFNIPLSNLDLGNAEASPRPGNGNGTYDYRGGKLDVAAEGGSGIRLAAGGGGGVGGVGRFIMRNPGPTSPGYARGYLFNVAANAGNSTILANGTTTGVGIVEFHSNGAHGTRPIQVGNNLLINNGGSGMIGSVRSSRLELVLDSAPTVDGSGVPQDLGLFDIDFDQTDVDVDLNPLIGNSTAGDGTLADFFSSADGSTWYTQGATVTAMFGASTYNWTISYSGNIVWADADASTIASISDTGGVDIVLKGLSSIIVPDDNPGDHDGDGDVDAADYVFWRKTDGGNMQGYNDWKMHFGETGSGSGGGGAVPEPASIGLVLFGVCAALLRRRA